MKPPKHRLTFNEMSDVDRSIRSERWFVDCKHYLRGVPPKELDNLLTWAQAERPDVAVFVVSNFLSNPAKAYLEAYKRNNNPPFIIKVWERTTLECMTRGKRELLQLHGVMKTYLRSESELEKAGKEFFDRVWYYRKLVMLENIKAGTETIHPEVLKRCKSAIKEMRKKYGSNIGDYLTDWEWGYLNGKFAAVRWMGGDEWDFLDT